MSNKLTAVHTPLQVAMRGFVEIEEIHPITKQPLRKKRWRNTVQANMRGALAASLAGEADSIPTQIALLRQVGALDLDNNLWDQTIVNADLELGATGLQAIGIPIDGDVISPQPMRAVLLRLKRIGTSAGTLTLKGANTSSGLPTDDGSGNYGPISDAVAINSLSTSYSWVRFDFPDGIVNDDIPVPQFLILESSGYTYSSGVTEVNVGADQTSPVTEFGVAAKYNGSAWSAISPDTVCAVRLIRQSHNDIDTIRSATSGVDTPDVIAMSAFASKSRQSNVLVRYMSQFTSAEALDYIAGLALFTDPISGLVNDEHLVLSWADVDYDKEFVTVAINVYWTLEVVAAVV